MNEDKQLAMRLEETKASKAPARFLMWQFE